MNESERQEHYRQVRDKRASERIETDKTSPKDAFIGFCALGVMVLGCGGCVSGCTPNPTIPKGSSLQPIAFDFGTAPHYARDIVEEGLEYEAEIKRFGGVGKVVEVFADGKAILENLDGDRIIAYGRLAVREDIYRLGVSTRYARRSTSKRYYISMDERLDGGLLNKPGFKFKSEIELELLLSRYGDINDKDKYEFQN
jgi:hypothetical protein